MEVQPNLALIAYKRFELLFLHAGRSDLSPLLGRGPLDEDDFLHYGL